jgi:hypothetical protein
MLEVGDTKGRDLQLEVRWILSGASRDRHEDVAWLDFMAPHRHLVVDVTDTSAHKNTNVPRIGARLPLPSGLALGAQHGKLDAAFALLLCLACLRFSQSMTTIPSLWRMEAGWRLWRLSWLIALLFWWQFVVSVAWVLHALVLCALMIMSVYSIAFVELLMFLLSVLGGLCDEHLCNVFLLLFMVLWIPVSETLCKRALVLMLWHAFLFLGLRFFLLFCFLLSGRRYFFLKYFCVFS